MRLCYSLYVYQTYLGKQIKHFFKCKTFSSLLLHFQSCIEPVEPENTSPKLGLPKAKMRKTNYKRLFLSILIDFHFFNEVYIETRTVADL